MKLQEQPWKRPHFLIHTHTHASVKGITRAEESGCWIFPPLLCQPFISRSEGGGECGAREGYRESETKRERETVSSFTRWRSAKNILYRFVCGGNREYVSIPHEPDLPVCLSVHLLSVVSAFTSLGGWLIPVCQFIHHQVCTQCSKS